MNLIFKVANCFAKKLAQTTCQYCSDQTYHIDKAFCSDSCQDQAFADDLQAYLKGDLNDATCVGAKKAPVGSPRQRSFCKRMCGHKKKNTGPETKSDPDSCINQALRRWRCHCS